MIPNLPRPEGDRRHARWTLLLPALVLASLFASAPPAPAAKPPRLQLDYVKYTLPNGLDVILREDHRLPIVGVNLWYHVGPANEEPGRTGFAHLFEHMMFQGSAHVGDEMHFKYLQTAGATIVNGSTAFDRTNYMEDIPSNQLELALWLESDRMGFLLDDLDQSKLSTQQDVVRNERRQSHENPPYGVVEEEFYHRLFPKGHPYYAVIIGSHEDLQSAKLDDVRDFFRRYYCPNNASLAIVGDIDIARTKRLVEKYFGTIPRGPDVPPIQAVTPPITAERRATVTDRVELPRVYMGWLTPPVFKPGDAEAEIAADALGGGKASRLYRKLVYELQIAQDVRVEQDANALTSMFTIQATARPGHSAEELEKAIDAELAAFVASGPTQAEVDAAQQAIYSWTVTSLERVGFFYGVADRLNRYNHYLRNPGYLNDDLARYAAVTPDAVKRFAGEYLRKGNRVVVYGVPGEKLLPPDPPTPPTPERVAVETAEREPWRKETPAAGPAAAMKLPEPRRITLPNGLTVFHVEDHHLPMVSATLVLRSGSASDPAELPGLADYTAAMLDEGTPTRDALAIAAQTHALGTSLSSGPPRGGAPSLDTGSLSIRALTGNMKPAMEILADVALHPAFPEAEIERVRQERLTALLQQRDSPPATARRVFDACFYGPTHPYGHIALGTEAALKRIARADMEGFYRRVYTPGNAALVLVGDITAADARKLAQEQFGAWQGQAVEVATPPAGVPIQQRVVIVDKPGAAQAQLLVGQQGVARSDPDYDALSLLNTVIGGSFSSRVNINLRERHGFTYGARSTLAESRGTGTLTIGAGVRSDATGAAVTEILKEVQGLKDNPVTDDELAVARGARIQALPGRFETSGSVADQIGSIFAYGLPDDYFRQLPSRLGAVTTKTLAEMARKHLVPEKMLIVAVGDRAKIEPQLTPLNLGAISFRAPDGAEAEAGAPAPKN